MKTLCGSRGSSPTFNCRIEETQGRLNFLSQTAAFSLIEVSLRLAPQTLAVNAGEDTSARVGQAVKFRASFTAPPGIDQYTYVWDFGDGTSAFGSGTIPTQSGERLTATITHSYHEDIDSEYIATITLEGTGEGGIAEGTDSLEVAVRRVPTISVFAGESRTVEEGATDGVQRILHQARGAVGTTSTSGTSATALPRSRAALRRGALG